MGADHDERGKFARGNTAGAGKRAEVESAAIRELVERSGVSLYELAGHIYGTDRRKRSDGVQRLCRMLGITTYTKVWMSDDERRKGTYRQQTMSADNALRIVRAIGLDPVDADL